ncbi:IclR family transcriptional regulator [Phytoactinopolyspora halotolerans]|uniref:Glycerol operon regulatory protein n=1 Tax=Phytoactinopolyspora halotolerans TaxID=1981512 RepID=A0A6L9SHD5_9ACTN|nr:IclR family transcriptional regulator [Phytoactinopolyspora halotolerans]NEE04547.1 IclR family transcriptional regulator [Phytoactinopolyspora halotolerans]
MPESGGVQSLDRAIDLLEILTDLGGDAGLSELASRSGLALPTIHRLLRTLVNRGYVRQLPSRRYTLGPRVVRLGEAAGRQLGVGTKPHLERLAHELGESVNLAILDGDMVVYVAQAASTRSMRMFTEVGRRVHCHSTGVGKMVLAQLADDDVHKIIASAGLPPATEHSITDIEALFAELDSIRKRGHAVDDGEQEIGVRCFAVPVSGTPTPAALSVSGPAVRVTDEFGERAVPLLCETAATIGEFLSVG